MAAYKATGYGNLSVARNVFGVLFSQALSALVKYYCYDNDEIFPQTDDLATADNDILAGIDSNNLSMVSLIDTTNVAPSSNWKPASASAGEANPNRMQAGVSYVEQDGAIRGAAERITYNMVVEFPAEATTVMSYGFDLKIVYSYTGSAPTVSFQLNTGTEGTPVWQTIDPEASEPYGILHCRSGSGPSGQGGDDHYYANIPESGTEDTAEGWADTSTTPA